MTSPTRQSASSSPPTLRPNNRTQGSTSQGESVGPERFVWEHSPSDLTFIRIDHQTRIQVERFEFAIGLPFSLISDGVVRALNPAERSQLGGTAPGRRGAFTPNSKERPRDASPPPPGPLLALLLCHDLAVNENGEGCGTNASGDARSLFHDFDETVANGVSPCSLRGQAEVSPKLPRALQKNCLSSD
jgi:hypothetical protein